MEQVISGVSWIWMNWDVLLGHVLALLFAANAIALLIPGEEPERTLGKVVEFLKKLSRK